MAEVRNRRLIRQIPELAVWGHPPFVPSRRAVVPHTGVRDMARMMDLATAGSEGAVQGMGQYQAGGQADYLTSIKSLADMYESLKPLIDFLGEHPWVTVGLVMSAIISGGAIGGYIGAGVRAERSKAKTKSGLKTSK